MTAKRKTNKPACHQPLDPLLLRSYGGKGEFVSSIQKGNVVATQFHPEKSGGVGLEFLRGFLESVQDGTLSQTTPLPPNDHHTQLVKRVVVALDVRTNDTGDLVVTKGDQCDVCKKGSGRFQTRGSRARRRQQKGPQQRTKLLDICAVSVARAAESLGAGEIMLNCIDSDGQCDGYDVPLIRAVSDVVSIPVIASSGAGRAGHFVDVFKKTNVKAALAAGMFHRKEVEIMDVKRYMEGCGVRARLI